MAVVLIKSFEPFVFEMPPEDPIPAGELCVALPVHHVQFGRMDLLDWEVGGDMTVASVSLPLSEPTAASAVAAMVVEMRDLLAEAHAEIQRLFDAKPIFEGGRVPASLQLAALRKYIDGG